MLLGYLTAARVFSGTQGSLTNMKDLIQHHLGEKKQCRITYTNSTWWIKDHFDTVCIFLCFSTENIKNKLKKENILFHRNPTIITLLHICLTFPLYTKTFTCHKWWSSIAFYCKIHNSTSSKNDRKLFLWHAKHYAALVSQLAPSITATIMRDYCYHAKPCRCTVHAEENLLMLNV